MIIPIRLLAKKLRSCDGNYSISISSYWGETITSCQIIVIRKIHGLAKPRINFLTKIYLNLMLNYPLRVRTILLGIPVIFIDTSKFEISSIKMLITVTNFNSHAFAD